MSPIDSESKSRSALTIDEQRFWEQVLVAMIRANKICNTPDALSLAGSAILVADAAILAQRVRRYSERS